MVNSTRLNQLQEGLTGPERSTKSQFKTLEVEMMTLKKQSDSVVQQLEALELQKKNNQH